MIIVTATFVFMPEKYVVGVATCIWKSENPSTGQMRWERVMKRID